MAKENSTATDDEQLSDLTEEREYDTEPVEPPIGWEGQTLSEMLEASRQEFEETGHYKGRESFDLKRDQPFTYEEMFFKLRGALVSARETAMNIASSAITNIAGELCFQVYTPEGDCIAASTGIMIHVHTGSMAIKWMIEEEYEDGIGIQPGDIFCNNECGDIGNVHTTDMHTIVPIFHDGELIAWVDGVNHLVEIGGITEGESLMASVSRYNDGIYTTCEKIGENDELNQDWKERSRRAVRTPDHFDLDEKCRLAGCHMIREAVKEMIDEFGVENYKQFTREAVEDTRRTFKEQVKERVVPGTYREVGFMPIPFEDEAWFPHAQENSLQHLPVEITVEGDGTLALDMEGASSPGYHSYNAAEATMAGGLWVILTQVFPLKGKINDGAHFALDPHFPEGSVVNAKDHTYSYTNAWSPVIPSLNSMVSCLSRGFFARGFREEVISGISRIDSVKGGGTYEPTGEHYPVNPFEISTAGLGASAIRDGLDWGYGFFNPECEMGDVEDWETIEKGLMWLGRKVKPNTAGHGKYRGGGGWETVRAVRDSSQLSLYKNRHAGATFTSYGINAGYPAAESYGLRAHNTDLDERIEEQEPYPISDTEPGTFNGDIEGDIEVTQYGCYWPKAFENGDLFHYQMHGAPGYGDPLERPIEKVAEDVEDEIFTMDVVEKVYGVVGELDRKEREFEIDQERTEQKREELREGRREETEPAREFWENERQRVLDGEFSDIVEDTYRDIASQSEEWMDSFREFWDLPADAYTEGEQ